MLYKLCVVLQGCIEFAETLHKGFAFTVLGPPRLSSVPYQKHAADEMHYRMLPLNFDIQIE